MNLMYNDKQMLGTYGKKDQQIILPKEEELEKTSGLENTYSVSGYPTQEVSENSKNIIIQPKENINVDENKLKEAQDYIAKTTQAINNFREFISKYIVSEDDIKFPDEIKKYAKEGCKKCYGRGIEGWLTLPDEKGSTEYKTFVRKNHEKVKLMPKFCNCTKEHILKAIENK